MHSLDIFRQTHVGPFIFYSQPSEGRLSLKAAMLDQCMPFSMEETWAKIDLDQWNHAEPERIVNAVISTRNRLANRCKRGPGNHVFMHPTLHAKWFNACTEIDHPTEVDGISYHVEEEMPDNEIRAVYHMKRAHMFTAVDGPYQIIGSKHFKNPNYLSYFYRMKIDV